MFSRRHPVLFSLLVFGAMSFTFTLLMTLLVVIGIRSSGARWPQGLEGEKIGVVEIDGYLVDSRKVVEDLKQFRLDEQIRAIVLRIDSPGGTVGRSSGPGDLFRDWG